MASKIQVGVDLTMPAANLIGRMKGVIGSGDSLSASNRAALDKMFGMIERGATQGMGSMDAMQLAHMHKFIMPNFIRDIGKTDDEFKKLNEELKNLGPELRSFASMAVNARRQLERGQGVGGPSGFGMLRDTAMRWGKFGAGVGLGLFGAGLGLGFAEISREEMIANQMLPLGRFNNIRNRTLHEGIPAGMGPTEYQQFLLGLGKTAGISQLGGLGMGPQAAMMTRAFGLPDQAGASLFGQTAALGITRNKRDMEDFAAILAGAIKRGGGGGLEAPILTSLVGTVKNLAMHIGLSNGETRNLAGALLTASSAATGEGIASRQPEVIQGMAQFNNTLQSNWTGTPNFKTAILRTMAVRAGLSFGQMLAVQNQGLGSNSPYAHQMIAQLEPTIHAFAGGDTELANQLRAMIRGQLGLPQKQGAVEAALQKFDPTKVTKDFKALQERVDEVSHAIKASDEGALAALESSLLELGTKFIPDVNDALVKSTEVINALLNPAKAAKDALHSLGNEISDIGHIAKEQFESLYKTGHLARDKNGNVIMPNLNPGPLATDAATSAALGAAFFGGGATALKGVKGILGLGWRGIKGASGSAWRMIRGAGVDIEAASPEIAAAAEAGAPEAAEIAGAGIMGTIGLPLLIGGGLIAAGALSGGSNLTKIADASGENKVTSDIENWWNNMHKGAGGSGTAVASATTATTAANPPVLNMSNPTVNMNGNINLNASKVTISHLASLDKESSVKPSGLVEHGH